MIKPTEIGPLIPDHSNEIILQINNAIQFFSFCKEWIKLDHRIFSWIIKTNSTCSYSHSRNISCSYLEKESNNKNDLHSIYNSTTSFSINILLVHIHYITIDINRCYSCNADYFGKIFLWLDLPIWFIYGRTNINPKEYQNILCKSLG